MSRATLLAAGILMAAGCTGTERRLPTDTSPDTTGGIQRASLELHLMAQAADSLVVGALAWGQGIPFAEVTVRRSGSSTVSTLTADASGRVTFTGLLPGVYAVNALRTLSPAERAVLPGALQEIDAVGGTLIVSVGVPSTSASLSMLSARRGTLVISELWSGDLAVGNGFYDDGDYLELFNNSDAPVNLANMLVVSGFPGSYDNPPFTSCNISTELQRDSLGIWATFVYAFPSTAGSLLPGRHVLLATDAIDHTLITDLAYDLSAADFEFRGNSDVDNPAVPDMVSVGPRDGGTPTGHGLSFYNSSPVVALAEALDVSTLPRVTAAVGGEWVRIPRTAILDVLSWTYGQAPTAPSCGPPVHDSLDGQQARLIGNWSVDLRSITRRSVSLTADGRPVLLRTRSSANDFVAAQPSPGRVP
ncbi:MAG: DUF4876 domain-containing protein [Gemmatimonadaceae bacterium]